MGREKPVGPVIALSFVLLCMAALIGGALALRFLRGPSARPLPPVVALVHGALGASSLAVLLLALRLEAPRHGMGTESFGKIAAGLLAFALLLGVIFLLGSLWGKRPAETVVGTHALLAIGALAFLLALIVLR